MKLASHNTMTYLKPSNVLLYPFRFIARCQKLSIDEQINHGVRLFDFRISFDKKGNPIFTHGLMKFKLPKGTTMHSILFKLDCLACKEDVWVRIINEKDKDYECFSLYCNALERSYKNIKFYGGYNKKGWKLLYSFKNQPPKVIDKYASWNNDVLNRGTGWLFDDIWPWIYAKLNNKKWRKKYANFNGFLMQDFIGIL